ncbi:MAG: radical SAM protein [Candidatus Eisenbacteria bacterium]
MRIVGSAGKDDIAVASIAEIRDGRYIEFVESLQPPLPRTKKWVLIVSTMFGCPVGCLMCDAGGYYAGRLTRSEITSQIDYLVDARYPDRKVDVEKFKVQFARMGEPSLNPAVLDVLEELPDRYRAPGLMPSVSSVAPSGSERFFDRLMDIKTNLYSGGRFQLQMSIHTTDTRLRDRLVPVRKWSLKKISAYGLAFHEEGDRKITLNSALADGMPLDPDVLLRYFDPEKFLIKLTPVNPTYQARSNGLASYIEPLNEEKRYDVVTNIREAGFEVIVSIGELEENLIGSNCGQYVMRHLGESSPVSGGYTYEIRSR